MIAKADEIITLVESTDDYPLTHFNHLHYTDPYTITELYGVHVTHDRLLNVKVNTACAVRTDLGQQLHTDHGLHHR